MLILITGGAGFIGSHLASELLKKGYSVRIIDNLYTGKRENVPKNAEFIFGDIRKINDLKDLLKDVECIFHHAAHVSVPESVRNPILDFDINVNGTFFLLEDARKHEVEKFIFASSAAIYGTTGEKIPETFEKNPKNPYGLNKLIAEKYCQHYYRLYGLKTNILRYFNVYGPKKRGNAVDVFIRNALAQSPLKINGDGTQFRDFVHVSDVVGATISCFLSDIHGEIYNVGTGIATKVIDLAEKIIKATGTSSKILFESPRPGDIKGITSDIKKIQRELSFVPQYSIEKGLLETLRFYNEESAPTLL
ncbi:NAD-dependent epimerase/dehydratase family protein [Candidatus Borrarchaeum sp.]|uniref:NAD-dependent epimerase/dehydratase family protein n=1 Tax=Candidatus Borrarchaeum sp. TaxID=2846742 RepID=UPI00257D2D94|nr:NAD-dependent epimerase/dehydratase family protein [Candidatus Borrarchaeum sp.]